MGRIFAISDDVQEIAELTHPALKKNAATRTDDALEILLDRTCSFEKQRFITAPEIQMWVDYESWLVDLYLAQVADMAAVLARHGGGMSLLPDDMDYFHRKEEYWKGYLWGDWTVDKDPANVKLGSPFTPENRTSVTLSHTTAMVLEWPGFYAQRYHHLDSFHLPYCTCWKVACTCAPQGR